MSDVLVVNTKRKKALIVDDSRLACFVLKEMLAQYGLDADAKGSAEEALGYLCTHRPDVIFMDHTMPGMDGFQAVEAIKQDPKTTSIPIMMYTSKEGEVYVSQARALGAVGVLPKQLKSVQLGEVLSDLGLREPTEAVSWGQSAGSVAKAVSDSSGGQRLAVGESDLDDIQKSLQAEALPADFIGPPRPWFSPAPAWLNTVEGHEGEVIPDMFSEQNKSQSSLPPFMKTISVPEAVDDSLSQLSASSLTSELDVNERETSLAELAHDAEEHSVEFSRLRPLLQEMLDEQRDHIRSDIRRGAITVTRHLKKGDFFKRIKSELSATYYDPPKEEARRGSSSATYLVLFLLPLLAWVTYQYTGAARQVAHLELENEKLLMENLDEENRLYSESLSSNEELVAQEARHKRDSSLLLDAVEWAVNSDNRVPYGQNPLGDKAVEILTMLMPKLIDTEFRGTIVLKSHNARFCLSETVSGEQVMASPGKPFKECKLVQQDLSESVEFTNYLSSLRRSGKKSIRVRIENYGSEEPLEDYPSPSEVKTAGEWNRIAGVNNRIEIAFERDTRHIALN